MHIDDCRGVHQQSGGKREGGGGQVFRSLKYPSHFHPLKLGRLDSANSFLQNTSLFPRSHQGYLRTSPGSTGGHSAGGLTRWPIRQTPKRLIHSLTPDKRRTPRRELYRVRHWLRSKSYPITRVVVHKPPCYLPFNGCPPPDVHCQSTDRKFVRSTLAPNLPGVRDSPAEYPSGIPVFVPLSQRPVTHQEASCLCRVTAGSVAPVR